MAKSTHVVLITVGPGNTIEADPVVRAEPDDTIVFAILNTDTATDYWVWIDPAEIIQRQHKGLATPPPTNPLQTSKHVKKVKPGEVDSLKHRIRPKTNFGTAAGQIPYTTYKYTIKSGLVQNDPMPVELDPDIDVITP